MNLEATKPLRVVCSTALCFGMVMPLLLARLTAGPDAFAGSLQIRHPYGIDTQEVAPVLAWATLGLADALAIILVGTIVALTLRQLSRSVVNRAIIVAAFICTVALAVLVLVETPAG